jgi:hypothetical protein
MSESWTSLWFWFWCCWSLESCGVLEYVRMLWMDLEPRGGGLLMVAVRDIERIKTELGEEKICPHSKLGSLACPATTAVSAHSNE